MISVTAAIVGTERLQTALAAPGASLTRLDVALSAWRMRLRDQFDELLCLTRLTHIRRLDYQVETVLKVLRTFRGRALLADEVGLGKTIEAGMLISEFVLRGMARRTLVIAPAALVGQWQSELSAKFGIAARSTDEALFRADPELAWQDASGVVVASLQLVRSIRHAALVREQKWDLVIVDEAHHIKNRDTAGYQLVDALKSRYLLLLTATPVENSLDELYNLVTLLRPGQLATPAAFKREFLAKGDPFSPRNREKLRGLLGEVMIRNTRALAGHAIELPPRFAQTVIVEPLPAERELYDVVTRAVRAGAARPDGKRIAMRLLLEQAGSSAQAVLAALARAAGEASVSDVKANKRGASPSRLPLQSELERAAAAACAAGSSKLSRLLEIVRTLPALPSGGKMLVFTRFRATLDFVCQGLAASGVAHVTFHGGMTGPGERRSRRAFPRRGLRDGCERGRRGRTQPPVRQRARELRLALEPDENRAAHRTLASHRSNARGACVQPVRAW